MRRILSLSAALLLITSLASAQRQCGTTEYMRQELAKNPGWVKNLERIEAQTQAFILENLNRNAPEKGTPNGKGKPSGTPGGGNSGGNGGGNNNCNLTADQNTLKTIPVAFHVVYKTEVQNVGDAMLQDQLDVLNDDFQKKNADLPTGSDPFASAVGNFNVAFCMGGVDRRQTSMNSFNTNDAVKSYSRGGLDAWASDKYLNIWVCNLGQGLLGYATFPGGDPSKDGIVILYSSLPGGSTTHYNLGRTATHEIGHWLNLRHIWGDATCGNDQVDDTPTQSGPNYGCPSYPHITCGNGPGGDMFMNYMDYVYDDCMTMFSNGQSLRGNALFASGGARQSILCSDGCTAATTQLSAQRNGPGLETFMTGSFKVYPSPASSRLNIELPYANFENKYISVYNINGQQMMQVKVVQSKLQLDISLLQKGVYFIKAGEGEDQMAQRFIKN